jgi:hypothetical protein
MGLYLVVSLCARRDYSSPLLVVQLISPLQICSRAACQCAVASRKKMSLRGVETGALGVPLRSALLRNRDDVHPWTLR